MAKKDNRANCYTEYSFQINDLDIAALMPPILEADHVCLMWEPLNLKVILTEMKGGGEKLEEDWVKHLGRGHRLILSDYTLILQEKNEREILLSRPDLMNSLFLRGCLGEIELFLNFLIANTHSSWLSIIAGDVFETLKRVEESLDVEGRRFAGNVLGRAVDLLARKAAWLAKRETTIHSKVQITDRTEEEYRRCIQSVERREGAVWIVTVGFLYGTMARRMAKTLCEHTEKRFIGNPHRVVLIYTKDSEEHFDKLKKHLKSDDRMEGVSIDGIKFDPDGKEGPNLPPPENEGQPAIVILTEFPKRSYKRIMEEAKKRYRTVIIYAMVPLPEPCFKDKCLGICVQGKRNLLCKVGEAEEFIE